MSALVEKVNSGPLSSIPIQADEPITAIDTAMPVSLVGVGITATCIFAAELEAATAVIL
jgi:hypothetical protein